MYLRNTLIILLICIVSKRTVYIPETKKKNDRLEHVNDMISYHNIKIIT